MLTSSWPESGTQHFLREWFDKTCRSVCSWWTTVSLSCFATCYEYLLEFTGQNLGSSPLWPIYLPPCPLAWTLQTQNKLSNKKITGPWNKSRATWDAHKSHKVFFQYLGLLSDVYGFSRIFLPSTQPILFSRTPSFACSAMADGRFNESTSLIKPKCQLCKENASGPQQVMSARWVVVVDSPWRHAAYLVPPAIRATSSSRNWAKIFSPIGSSLDGHEGGMSLWPQMAIYCTHRKRCNGEHWSNRLRRGSLCDGDWCTSNSTTWTGQAPCHRMSSMAMENSHQTGDHFQLWSQSLGSVTDLRNSWSVPCRARALQIRCPPGLHDPTCCGHQRGMLVSSSCRISSSNADQIWSMSILWYLTHFKTKSMVQSGRIGNSQHSLYGLSS